MVGERHPNVADLYYHTAGDAMAEAKKEIDNFEKAERISTCMVFSALCLEAYINETFHKFLETRKIIENDNTMSCETKWLMLPLLLGAKNTFSKDKEPFQTFKELLKTRNQRLVHCKPHSETETTEKPLKSIFFSELVTNVSLAEKYWKCVSEMIFELNRLTSKTEIPAFIKGDRYLSTVSVECELKFDIG
jgi:hypothetical protein